MFAGDADAIRDFSVGHSVTLRTAPEATVTVTDRENKEAFWGNAGDAGVLTIPLLQYRQTPQRREDLTPHKIVVTKGELRQEREVVVTKKQEIAIPLEKNTAAKGPGA